MSPEIPKDFDKLLERLFAANNPSQQPKYLVEIDCQDGETLSLAYGVVKPN